MISPFKPAFLLWERLSSRDDRGGTLPRQNQNRLADNLTPGVMVCETPKHQNTQTPKHIAAMVLLS